MARLSKEESAITTRRRMRAHANKVSYSKKEIEELRATGRDDSLIDMLESFAKNSGVKITISKKK